MLPERRDASSFDDEQTHRPLTRRPTLRVAYLRKTDGHTREKPPKAAPRDVTRVSLVKEPERRQARESRAELNSCATGVRLLARHVCIFM